MAKWVINTIQSTGYFGIVCLMFLENVFPPIPSEVIMPLAGFLVAEGKQNFAGVVIAGMVGSVLGALPLYYAGYLLGEERLKAFADKHGRWLTISRDDLERAKKWFDQHLPVGARNTFFDFYSRGYCQDEYGGVPFLQLRRRGYLDCSAGLCGIHPGSKV